MLLKLLINKKVLLRERKRHAVRHVASACYAGGGGPYPVMVGGGVPHPVLVGVPHPVMVRGGYPIQSW